MNLVSLHALASLLAVHTVTIFVFLRTNSLPTEHQPHLLTLILTDFSGQPTVIFRQS